MIGVSAFVAKVRAIADRNPTYRTGGVGKDGTCDCIGLVMGAMYELGHKKYDLHSSNYFARYQMQTIKKVYEKDLAVGQILYRSRKDSGQLNARYQAGGRYYNGDKLDYYHAGVVTRVNPLEIIECTESGYISGIVISSDVKKWQYAGELKDVLYEGYEPDEREEKLVSYKAIVTTEKDPLRVREWPETGTILGKVPKGRTVDVLAEAGDGWPKIRYNELMGYASEQYLTPIGITEKPNDTESAENDTENAANDTETAPRALILMDSEGNVWRPVGGFTVEIDDGSID